MPITPIPTTDSATGTISEEDSHGCGKAQAVGNIAPDVVQTELLNGSSGGMNLPCTAPSIPMATTILEFSYNDHGWLFELYDSELCVLPLTSDFAINPFRCKIPAQRGSRVLFHAVLALCYRHLNYLTCNWSDEVTAHHGKAVQLLESALQSQQSRNNLQLLEPILILFTLDCTLSATGLWSIHLQRAYSLLQACGGPVCLTSQRTRSQVGMLLWWDATLALISRRCPVLDRPYLDYLVQWEQQDDWSFFDLTGCPRDLFVILYNLAELARQSEIAASMKWLTFDLAPVFEVEEKLRQWNNDLDPLLQKEDPKLSNAEREKKLHELQDRYHCAEAWRCALLLYIESVFKREDVKSPFSLALLVRKTLDHIRCCRQSSQTQKQLLLPVFIAGSETSDSDMRDFVTSFCQYWGDKSRYSMFNSVPTLLDEIWSTGNWWGTVIDGRTTSTKVSSSVLEQSLTQVLLG